MKEKFEIQSLESWEDYKKLIDNSPLEWIYRGHSDHNWELNSSLYRSKIIEHYDNFESEILIDFKRASNHYLKKHELPDNLVDWLALIQHYGAPTRLIDFTTSPYVAAYFAFEGSENGSEYIAIWIANKIHFFQNALNYFQRKNIKISITNRYSYSDEAFRDLFEMSRSGDVDNIIPVESYAMNERYYLQQSIFLSPVNPYKSFLEQLVYETEIDQPSLIKVLIPSTERKKALRDLSKMNITRASLFPGLEGFARSLYLKYDTLSTIKEMAEKLNYLKQNKYL